MLARDENAQARRTIRARRREQGIPGPAASCAFAQQALEIRLACEPLFCAQPEARPFGVTVHVSTPGASLHGEALATLGAPGAQDGTTLRGTAAHKESMRSCTPRLGRLVGALLLHGTDRSRKGAVLEPARRKLVKCPLFSLLRCG